MGVVARRRPGGRQRALQTAVLTNLGTTYKNLGDRGRAVDFYEQSYKLNEALGNDQGAAHSQATAGALLIEHGDPDAGLRDVQNALTVVRKIGDRNFEVSACRSLLHMIAPMATSSRQHEN